ncbi:MAG: radical SAM family heme chaperone HemW [Bacteroidales bacterium]|jgi:oxygen-independent coproporphyrinogen-3 oxidase|nr:radical SAM family heme chaperone HemW [Bacteroidales bacterium]NCU35278.1 radical SAM family heme chaperone HemW [Candidatus Falkowbacteria bacterium]MDD2630886.1 radical SAM family heme chaperone HemW [Bacteroidales bacterium]MDD3526710.1 radical SAM family heme chaperone HemW [Bacteroidales bacterium]MDD4176586.1 radical SAM family heme chaperone HemW [Bacteroidales bacterium]
MAGLYIHIPYCRQKCHYCNFYSLASRKYRELLPEALQQEMILQKDYLTGETLHTIYIGGGTPTVYPPQVIAEIILAATKQFKTDARAEINIEANPDDLLPDYLHQLRKTPVNRLSIGIQSFHDDDLHYLNRNHSAANAYQAIRNALAAGFDNLNVDLIYGIPGLTDKKWGENIKTVLDFHIPHISAYALTVEPGTALDKLINKKKLPPVEEQQAADQFVMLMEMMAAAGYEHYEISNFCKPGQYARHNTSYWQGISYLGIGPSAHAFDGRSRQWNVSNLEAWLQGIRSHKPAFEREILSPAQQLNEYVMTSLRTMWGTDLQTIQSRFGAGFRQMVLQQAASFQKQGLVFINEDIITLTQRGKLFADGIAAELFVEDSEKTLPE